jgi:hypothetical protein
MKSMLGQRPTVGVDADNRVWVHGVGVRRALIIAGRQRGVIGPRQLGDHPHSVSAAATRVATSPVEGVFGYPSLLEVPVVSQSFVPPRPVGTCRAIVASLTPLCPGSRKTDIPAMPAACAIAASSAGTVDHRTTIAPKRGHRPQQMAVHRLREEIVNTRREQGRTARPSLSIGCQGKLKNQVVRTGLGDVVVADLPQPLRRAAHLSQPGTCGAS